MKKLPRYAIVLIVATLGVVLSGLALPALARRSNCGGNSAALVACKNSYLTLLLLSDGEGVQSDTHQLLKDNFAEISKATQNHWIPGAKILLRTNFFVDPKSKQILAVCDTAYSNVPQPTIWNGYKKTPGHAVAYSDGTSGLITPAQFKELNLSQFIDVSGWRTNGLSETNGVKGL